MILLDTHVLIWLDQDSSDLGANCRAAADSALADDALAVSAISFWEVAMLAQRKRLSFDMQVSVWRRDLLVAGVRELAVDGRIGIQAASLAELQRDPADRLIAATAQVYGATLATADQRLLDWRADLPRLNARK
ncbi:MAG: type II toxin-antitoxin system VapC family toxin [Halieaceae bacterium]|nr:type II toxin-antitoxin system VapC family toxin [Halieaceae bacterium]